MAFKQFLFDIKSSDLQKHILKGDATSQKVKDINHPDFKDLQNGYGKRAQLTGLGDKIWMEPQDNGVYQFMPVSLNGISLWNPIIRAVGRKTIVETPLIERRGSVKEIISIDDYVINIRGIIKRKDGYWPDRELEELLSLYRLNEAIPIQSALTGRLLNGEEYVVITNLDLPEQPGFVESINYSIECVSDIPFELELEE